MKIENLPSHEECGEAVSSDLATPLHQFIYDNEPAGKEDEKAFRIGLVNMLNDHAKKVINTPEVNDFMEGVKLEAAHQTARWGEKDEHMKPPHHYIMVFTKLLGKMSVAIWDRDIEKFKHHCITMGAVGHNVHRQVHKRNTEVNNWFKTYHTS